MRSFLTFLLCAFSFIGNAQNYQPINSHSLQVFYQENAYAEYDVGNMWGTRIDSVVVDGSDTIFFNYPIVRDTASENGNLIGERCLWYNAANWNGPETGISTENVALFKNLQEESIAIHYSAPTDSTWLAYVYPNGDSLMASVDSITFTDDEWIADSLKIVSFQRISNGVLVQDEISGKTLELYKSHGFRKMIDFVKFPFESVPIYQVDPNSINVNSVPFRNVETQALKPKPVVGGGFFQTSRTEDIDGTLRGIREYSGFVEDLVQLGGDTILISWLFHEQESELVEVQIPEAPNGWGYQWQTSDLVVSQVEEILIPNQDSAFRPLVEGNKMPRENRATYRYLDNFDSEFCGSLVMTYANCYETIEWTPNPIDSCLVTDNAVANNCGANEHSGFLPYIGQFSYSSYDVTFSGSNHFFNRSYDYYNSVDYQCGEYQMVPISEPVVDAEFSVYPNPANQTVAMSLSSLVGEYELMITDLAGREMMRTVDSGSQLELNVSNWPNGVYLVNLIAEKGITATEKLIVQH